MAARDSNLLAEIDRHFLLCGICSERYRNAKILPCLHSFCEPCTNKLVKTSDSSITCPVCRRSHELPNGVSSISSNGFLNDLVDLFAKRESEDGSRNCQACEQEGATTRCIECAFDICQLCASAHTKFPLMKAHRLMSLDDYNVARCSDLTSIQPPVYCSAHREYQIEFFCDTCKEAICLKCTALDHAKPEHRYRCVREAAGSFIEDLSAIIDKVKEKETEAVGSKVAVQQVLDSLDSCFRKETDEVSQHIRQKVEEHTRVIQENGNKLQAELKAEYEKRKFNLTAQLKELDITENDLKCTREYVETLLQYGNAPQLTSAKKGVEDQAGELLKLKTRVSPTEDDYMEFVRCDDVCKDWRLGEINLLRRETKKTDNIETKKDGSDDKDDPIAITQTEVVTQSISDELETDFEENGKDKNEQKMKRMENDETTGLSKCMNFAEICQKASVSKKPEAVSPSKPLRTKRLVCKFKGRGSGTGQFIGLQGIKVMSNGDLLICEHNNGRLQSYSVGGQYRKTITFPKLGDFRPYDVALSENGHLNITDFGNKHVIVCDENGKLIRCLGNGKLINPMGVSVNPINGRVYVVDNKGHCVLIYNQDGSYNRSFGSFGSHEGQLRHPRYVFVDHSGNVYVSDCVNHRIQVFDGDGRFLFAFGRDQLYSPTGLAVDKHGYVYVTDNINDKILKYDRQGEFVCRIDDTRDGLKNPIGVCVTDDFIVAVCDHGNDCIKVFSQ